MDGRWIIFEGGDGTGKSTQAGRFGAVLASRGLNPLHIREPGSTPLGEKVREILLAREKEEEREITPETEMLLYMACRAQLFRTVIRPALREGRFVLQERNFYSTYAYQGFGLGLDTELILRLGQWVSSEIEPDRVILLDLEAGKSLARLRGGKDRIENRGRSFHERVRSGYLDLSRRYPGLFRVIDADGSIEQVESRIHAEFRDLL